MSDETVVRQGFDASPGVPSNNMPYMIEHFTLKPIGTIPNIDD